MTFDSEPVFGDQTWFDDGPDDAEMVAIYALRHKRWYKLQDGECYFYLDKEQSWERCSNGYPGLPLLAQRRIIRTPTWSKADQMAGLPPEVGCMVMVTSVDECASVAAINNDAVCVVFHDGEFTTLHKSGISPIETPEKKAERLRDEWRIKALSSASILSGMQEYELKRLGGYIGDIYDALLSGELTMPSKDGE